MPFRVAIGSCSCDDGAQSKDPHVRLLCGQLLQRLATLRAQTPSQLRAMDAVTLNRERLEGRPVSIAIHREELGDGAVAIIARGFMATWKRPNYFGPLGVGRMYANGFVLAADGSITAAADDLLWAFR